MKESAGLAKHKWQLYKDYYAIVGCSIEFCLHTYGIAKSKTLLTTFSSYFLLIQHAAQYTKNIPASVCNNSAVFCFYKCRSECKLNQNKKRKKWQRNGSYSYPAVCVASTVPLINAKTRFCRSRTILVSNMWNSIYRVSEMDCIIRVILFHILKTEKKYSL